MIHNYFFEVDEPYFLRPVGLDNRVTDVSLYAHL